MSDETMKKKRAASDRHNLKKKGTKIHKKGWNQTDTVEVCLTIVRHKSSKRQKNRINIVIARQDVHEERMTPKVHIKTDYTDPFQNRRRIKKDTLKAEGSTFCYGR